MSTVRVSVGISRRVSMVAVAVFMMLVPLVFSPAPTVAVVPSEATSQSVSRPQPVQRTVPPGLAMMPAAEAVSEDTESAGPLTEAPITEGPITEGPVVGEAPRPVTVTVAVNPSSGAVEIQGEKDARGLVYLYVNEVSGEPLQIINPESDVAESVQYSATMASVPSGPAVEIVAVQRVDTHTEETRSTSFAFIESPTITPTDTAAFGIVGGTGYPGAMVHLSVLNHGTVQPVRVSQDGTWVASLDSLQLGAGAYSLVAHQVAPFGTDLRSTPSAAVEMDVVIDRPDAPTLDAPTNNARIDASGAIARGSGAPEARITVDYGSRDREGIACTANAASDGAWSCEITDEIPAGTYQMSATQQNDGGMVSPASQSITVHVVAAEDADAEPLPRESREPNGDDAPIPNDDQPYVEPPNSPAPEEHDSPEDDQSDVPDPERFRDIPPTESDSPITAMLVPTGTSGSWGPLFVAFGALVAMMLAVALRNPVRALVAQPNAPLASTGAPITSVPGRRRPKHAALPGMSGLTLGVLITVAAGAVFLSVPGTAGGQWTRVLAAALCATVIVNGVSLLVTYVFVRRVPHAEPVIGMSGIGLVLLGSTVLISRLTSIEPPVIFALLAVIRVQPIDTAGPRRRAAVARPLTLLLLGGIAVFTATALSSSGYPATFARETAIFVASAALGSAALSMLPVARLDGRVLWAWSRWLWLGATVVSVGATAALLSPSSAPWFPGLVAGALVVIVIALIIVTLWNHVVRQSLNR